MTLADVALGLCVTVIRIAPLGDPIELRVRGCHLSIRRDEVRCIDVSTEAALLPESVRDREPISIRPGLPAAP